MTSWAGAAGVTVIVPVVTTGKRAARDLECITARLGECQSGERRNARAGGHSRLASQASAGRTARDRDRHTAAESYRIAVHVVDVHRQTEPIPRGQAVGRLIRQASVAGAPGVTVMSPLSLR